MTVVLCMPYELMLVLMILTLTLMQGHSGSAKANNHHCMLSATKQAININGYNTVYYVWVFLHDLDFANEYMARPACLFCFHSTS